ncbi:hypothetical protein HBZS_106560 [Helicobacter bizzozeronii CCUG 35545]|nr:hypothetical protein HBZS_106560 [Helicobacter bizzozeronii CCUG 35545]
MGKEHFVQASSVITLSFAIFQALFSFIFTWALGLVSFFCHVCGVWALFASQSARALAPPPTFI